MNLGAYMRGGMTRPEEFQVQPDTGMNPVLQGMMYGQQQDERAQQLQTQQFNLGQAQQQADNQQQLNALASQAYTAAPDQRNTLLANMAKLDPREAAAQQQQFTQMDAATRERAAQAMQQAAGMATAVSQMPAGPQKQQAWASILARMHAAGKDTSLYGSVGPDVGAKMMLAQIASSKELLDMAGAQQKKYTLAEVPYGTGKAAVVFDPSTGTYKPLAGAAGGAQAAPSGLPAETEAYVPKVMAALGGAQPFDANGQPTQQLLDAVQHVESGGNPTALSPKGAQGAYQLMPATAASVGVTNPNDPAQARVGAAKYLAQLYQQFGGDANKAIAAYNAGPGRVQQALGGAHPVLGIGTSDAAGKAPAGYEWNVAHTSLQPIPGGPADKQSIEAALGDPALAGQAYLQSIPDVGLQSLIMAIAEGREQVPRIYRAGKAGEIGPTQIAAAVSQYDPTFNAQDYQSRNKTRISFTSGPDSKNMMNLNQAAAHAAQLAQQIPNLAGHFLPFGLSDRLNSSINNATQGGTAALKSWNVTADALAHEARAVFAGSSGGTLEELNRNLQTLNGNDPVSSKQAALQSIGRLLQSRIGLLQDKYQQGMGKAGDPFATTYPGAARVLNALADSDPSKIGFGAIGSIASQPAPSEGPHTGAQSGGASHIPAAAIQYLKAHPETAAQFDAQFGPGSAQAVVQ